MALLPLYAYIVAFSHAVKNDVYIPRAPSAGPEDFDCPMRQLALEFAMSTQPFLAQDKLQEIADALNGAQEAVNHSCVTVPADWPIKETLPPSWSDSDSDNDIPSIYVDFTRGDDANDGSIAHPLQHLDSAVLFARKHFGPSTPKRIVLRKGRHYLRRTVNITAEDNDLTLTNFDSELVELSGAQPINCDWQHMAGNDSWKVLPNTDGIFAGPPSPGQNSSVDLYLGQAASFADCQALVLPVYKALNLGAFTWQDSTAGSWANVCYGIVGGNYKTNTQSNAQTAVLVSGANLYSCKVTDSKITEIDGLRVNGTRAIRARYPNGNPEVFPCGFCSTLKAKSWLAPTCVQAPTMEYWPDEPLRNDTPSGWFQKYQLGVGGCCDGFTPNAGYWCGNHTQGGGAFTYLIPSGLTYDAATLPNAPYANPKNAVIQTWRPGHWSSWMFEVDDENYDPSSKTIKFSKGGFQGARGNKAGDEFYIENVFEELDSANEWFFNDSTRMLYFIANGTDTPADLVFEATNLRVLMNYTGTMAKPVENQVIRGMTLRDTRTTYLDPHGMPSGGDWGLERTGAIYLDGVKGVEISSNVLTRLDGNAISVNRYARDVVITKNEIVWNGDNAVSMWGDTQDIAFPDGTTMGYDGTDGNQPRGVQFVQNLVHEIGIWEKQSSMWFQAKSCSNVLDSNIFYNGPRAGINFNDGFGGNSTLKKNLLFNTCRESGDHGPFNSWDRQVYVTAVKNGTPSVIKEWDEITQNMMVANYNGQEGVDNDDGSAYYHTHGNFFVYSGNGMKNDFGGHDNHHYNNVYGYIGNCFKIVGQIEGHEDAFYNNTCVLSTAQTQYGSFDCNAQTDQNSWPKLGDNQVYVASGDPSKVGLCGMTEEAFQKANAGVDDGTVINGPPDNAQLIAAAKKLLLG